MRKLVVFENVSLDGYFADKNGDLDWAHKPADSADFNKFVQDNASSSEGGVLLFGRITYQMMVSYWPTPAALRDQPEVANGMNRAPKVVFSRTLDAARWENTALVKGDLLAEVRRLKQAEGGQITILGSGSIVSQLTKAELIDEYDLVVNPVILGEGRKLFEGVMDKVDLKLVSTKSFTNGNVLMTYVRPGP
jgi:dihydrofolate reductase